MPEKISVSALNRYVKSVLDGDEALSDIAIVGEISNFNRHFKTGHCYFSLTDSTASVKAVMFRGDAQELAFNPENGMKVIARGRVSLYERDGAFQLYVDAMFQDGVGAAFLAFEELKEQLAKQGFFAAEHKKQIPEYPRCIGLVTSKTGAAIQDILHVAERRDPNVDFILAPAKVQGWEAAREIVRRVRVLNTLPEVDLIIIARGGGSAEDLAVFNDEQIARAVFDSDKPVISAIGHEIDFTILDLVADLRAPTPSAAAEIAVPDMKSRFKTMELLFSGIVNNMHNRLDLCYNTFMRSRGHAALLRASRAVADRERELNDLSNRIQGQVTSRLSDGQNRYQIALSLASGLDPYAVLARGYAMASVNGVTSESVANIKTGDRMDVTFADGVVHTEVKKIEPIQEAHKDEQK